ncbi:ribosomal L11 methyltransferase [Xanthobacter versatilis]|uniref:Ribosomal protein L11 methyltransferase n=1 Tax=Xanthobacter autotrophicus (strain ATCC BAA-1158 / Py2) TaxID=78245 RepID=A7IF79_XANP2|nr:ribosomal L11 methyltransferase [Xanthobacter autotrophicus Py2]
MIAPPMLEGLPPNDATHVMRVEASRVAAQRISDMISETFDPAEVAVANFERTDNDWVVEVYAGAAFDPERLREMVEIAAGPEIASTVTFGDVEEKDWVAASLEGLAPVRVGTFVVHGGHDRGRVGPNLIGIEIEAALAFGTGHHGTTQGCLHAITDAARRGAPRRVLDVGTGTGVLAIAADRLFHTHVVGSDIDAIAVRTARANAKANKAPAVQMIHAAGAGARVLRVGGPYDLILANILLPPLKRLARPLRRLLAPGGRIVLSGLLSAQVPAALAAYRAQGLRLVSQRHIEGWATLTLAADAGRPLR